MEDSVHEQVPYVEREGDVGPLMDGVNAEKWVWVLLHDFRLADKNVRNSSVRNIVFINSTTDLIWSSLALFRALRSLLVPLFSQDPRCQGELFRSGDRYPIGTQWVRYQLLVSILDGGCTKEGPASMVKENIESIKERRSSYEDPCHYAYKASNQAFSLIDEPAHATLSLVAP